MLNCVSWKQIPAHVMHAQQISLRENSFDKNNDDRTLMESNNNDRTLMESNNDDRTLMESNNDDRTLMESNNDDRTLVESNNDRYYSTLFCPIFFQFN